MRFEYVTDFIESIEFDYKKANGVSNANIMNKDVLGIYPVQPDTFVELTRYFKAPDVPEEDYFLKISSAIFIRIEYDENIDVQLMLEELEGELEIHLNDVSAKHASLGASILLHNGLPIISSPFYLPPEFEDEESPGI